MTIAPEEKKRIYAVRKINSQYVLVQLLVNDLPTAHFIGTGWRRGAGMINIDPERIMATKTLTEDEAEDIYMDMELDEALRVP